MCRSKTDQCSSKAKSHKATTTLQREKTSIGEAEESNKEESTTICDSSLFQYLNWYEIPGFKTPFSEQAVPINPVI